MQIQARMRPPHVELRQSINTPELISLSSLHRLIYGIDHGPINTRTKP